MKPLPRIGWLLGYAGLIPFVLLTLLLLTGKNYTFISSLPLAMWQATYGAIIVSFLGAISWGVALGMQDQLKKADIDRLIFYSVIPSILAWFALFLPTMFALFVLAGLIIIAYIADALLLFPKINSEYARLRMHLTIVVAISLCVSAIVTA